MNSVRTDRSTIRVNVEMRRGLHLFGLLATILASAVGLPAAAVGEDEQQGHAIVKAMPVKRGMSEQAISCIACH